jgi:hypothetical protein
VSLRIAAQPTVKTSGAGVFVGKAFMELRPIYNGRYFAREDGTIWNVSGKEIKGGLQSKGYLTVSLYDGSKPKKPRSFLVHRLIAEAFFGESILQINHKNGDKKDNRVENLEYCTPIENARHAISVLGKSQSGEKHPRKKLTAQQVTDIRQSFGSHASIGRKYNISASHVRDIRLGKYWNEK